MTLSETDRLIRKLRETLKTPDAAVAAAAGVPAQAYADACSSSSRRLEQCAVMLDAGDEQQALQLAETHPALLDVLTLLSFGESGQWREFCHAHGLPTPEAFDARNVSRVNALYSKGITVQHPLYRDYRTQVMKNRPDEAAATLRSIVRLNPADTNARDELARLEEKRLAARLEQLATILAAKNEQATVDLVDSIEDQAQAAGLKPEGATWTRALSVRQELFKREASVECHALLPQLDSLRAAGKWQAAAAMLAHARQLQAQHGFDLEADDARRFGELREWTTRSQRDQERQQAFTQSVVELGFAIEQSEGRHAAAGIGALPALRTELATLHKRWRETESFEQALPEGLEGRYRKRAGTVRLEIENAQRRRTLLTVAGCAAAALVCAAGSYFFVQHQKSSELAAQFDRLVAQRQVEAAGKLLEEVRTHDPARLEGAAARAAAARTQVFIDAERTRQRDTATRIAFLEGLAAESHPFASRDIPATNTDLLAARTQAAALAPDFRPPAEARLAAVRNRWEAFLAAENAARTEAFSKTLDATEKQAADNLNYRSAEGLRHALADLAPALEELAGMNRDAAIPQLKLRDDLGTRYDALSLRTAAYRKDLDLYDGALAGLARADTLDAYLQALRNGQDSELGRTARDLAPAKRLLTLPVSPDALEAAALMPGDEAGWTFFKANPTAGFVPASAVLDPEQRIYDQLLVDSNIRNVYRYPAENRLGSKGFLFTRGTLQGGVNNGGPYFWGARGNYYDVVASPAVLDFVEGDLAVGVAKGEAAPDTQAFLDSHLRDLIDTDAERFGFGTGAPVHEYLDRLTRSRASPLFKAFVFVRMAQMMQAGQRPGFFGWQYSPALRLHFKEAQELVPPRSGYWMVPKEIREKGEKFEKLFARAAKISYAQQAKLLQAATREALAGGLNFKGYVDPVGAPHLTDPEGATAVGAPPPDLWGWEKGGGQPARLFVWSAADKSYKAAPTANALPSSPLLAFGSNGGEVLHAAARQLSIGDEEIKAEAAYLPPFFQN